MIGSATGQKNKELFIFLSGGRTDQHRLKYRHSNFYGTSLLNARESGCVSQDFIGHGSQIREQGRICTSRKNRGYLL
jgi:hypothetical protein